MVALVTGASRGIGHETAAALAAQGWDVAVNYHRSREAAESLVQRLRQEHGVNAAAYCCDVSDAGQVAEMFRQVNSQLGWVELLVNNAGVAHQALFTDITEEEWDSLFAVDVKGIFLCCREALREMVSHKKGSIINISSIWGITGASCEVHYSAAKAAVIGLTKALAKEVGLSGIRVNCIAPGVIDTQMNRNLDETALAALREETPLGRLGSTEDIAQLAAFLASDRAGFITGQVISPNGGIVI